VYSCASGLDYPGVGPEHCYLKDSGRVEYVTCSDEQCADAFLQALPPGGPHPGDRERARGGARAREGARDEDRTILVNLSGRGDKDLDYVLEN
jgi:tryptophan synthase beta subunit